MKALTSDDVGVIRRQRISWHRSLSNIVWMMAWKEFNGEIQASDGGSKWGKEVLSNKTSKFSF